MLANWKFPLAVIVSLLPFFAFLFAASIHTRVYTLEIIPWLWLRSWFFLGRNSLSYLGSLFATVPHYAPTDCYTCFYLFLVGL